MSRPRSRFFRPIVEGLDGRCLLAASGLTPAQILTAYGLDGLTFGGHAADGSGQTIAIVDAFNDPNIAAELAAFDAANQLPAPPSLTVIGQSGSQALPRTDAGWAQEEALDVEWAHAIAPGASIILVETNSVSMSDLMAGVKTAIAQPGVSVVSMSWGGKELPNLDSYDHLFATTGITFVAASGDHGSAGGAQWPASSGNVVGVGGTSLHVSASGTYQSESAWVGSSGGISTFEPEPSYQAAVQSSGYRSTPDVAFDGDTSTGVGVYSINPLSGQGSWLTVGGTSLGAPAWAAIIAIVDQGRAQNNAPPLSSLQTLTALYGLPVADFHVIGGGFNTQTGLGTPVGGLLVNALVAYNTATPTSTPTSSPTPTPTIPTPTPTGPDWPTIPRPISTPPATSLPVVLDPISSPPISNVPLVSQEALTPPPAAPPVSVKKVGKKKAVNKHASGHAKHVVHRQPHPHAHAAHLEKTVR